MPVGNWHRKVPFVKTLDAFIVKFVELLTDNGGGFSVSFQSQFVTVGVEVSSYTTKYNWFDWSAVLFMCVTLLSSVGGRFE